VERSSAEICRAFRFPAGTIADSLVSSADEHSTIGRWANFVPRRPVAVRVPGLIPRRRGSPVDDGVTSGNLICALREPRFPATCVSKRVRARARARISIPSSFGIAP